MEPSSLKSVSSPSMFIYDNPPASSKKSRVQWTREEDKIFEDSIAEFGVESQFLLPYLAMKLQTKSVLEIKEHYKILLEDVEKIEAGLIELPNYETTNAESRPSQAINTASRPSQADTESHGKRITKANSSGSRNKSIPWTKAEHESFVRGLVQYGKGAWKKISTNCVISKTPAQVASHAQKYFKKLNNPNARPGGMRTVESPQVEDQLAS